MNDLKYRRYIPMTYHGGLQRGVYTIGGLSAFSPSKEVVESNTFYEWRPLRIVEVGEEKQEESLIQKERQNASRFSRHYFLKTFSSSAEFQRIRCVCLIFCFRG